MSKVTRIIPTRRKGEQEPPDRQSPCWRFVSGSRATPWTSPTAIGLVAIGKAGQQEAIPHCPAFSLSVAGNHFVVDLG